MTTRTNTAIPTHETTAQLAQLLPELAVTLYEAIPHGRAGLLPAGEELTGSQRRAVVYLAHHGSATMSGLAAGLGIGRAAATELVARLVARGIVQREPDESDRRVVRVRLAGQASAYAERLFEHWRKLFAAVYSRHPAVDPDGLVAFLRALIAEFRDRPTT